ncbi:MFS transporter [Saccharothrix sp.]|uniref:MFS transporter n=1 Tax=Saccharothrix sp. TaxID=1873460 RepID=UPI00281202DE|nr:MFS transporter [Saccharothrix sp.]
MSSIAAASACASARGLLGITGTTLMPSTLALIGSMFRDPRQRGAGVVFLRRQRRLSLPLLDLRLFAARPFRDALLVLLAALACVAGVYLFAALYLQQQAGLSPIRAGLWVAPSAVAMVLTSMAAPALARRIPVHRLLVWSLAVSAVGFAVLARTPDDQGSRRWSPDSC